jgi:Holliday junction DNA helicase RuvB
MSAGTINRPQSLDAMVGQEDLRRRLSITLAGAKARGVRPPHVLLYGPAGHGKTTLAKIIANELGGNLITTTGPALAKVSDVAGIFGAAGDGDVVFIDEIHRLPVAVAETLYEILEDGVLSVTVGQGELARSIPVQMDQFIVVGATTLPGKLPEPLRDRFGFRDSVKPYTDAELATIVSRAWLRADAEHTEQAAALVASRSKRVPRVALHLADRVLDYSAVTGGRIDLGCTRQALDAFGIGEGGLDETDVDIITALVDTFGCKPVGLHSLAQACNIDAATIEKDHEGNLVRAGFMVRTAAGRLATPLAIEFVKSR